MIEPTVNEVRVSAKKGIYIGAPQCFALEQQRTRNRIARGVEGTSNQ